MDQNLDTEIILDFNKALKTIIENKKTIFIWFLIFMGLGVILNFALPKKYTSEAQMLIKKSGSTNLSYINPFVVPDNVDADNYSNFFFAKNSLSEEIEIIKSPLIIDKVVKENNLKYDKGPAKGKYLSTKDFLRKNFNISKVKDADIIYISYKSKSPILSYNVVNSIIKNYKRMQQNINLEKASSDTAFLKKASLKAEKELYLKINQIKKFKYQSTNSDITPSTLNFSLLSFYDKRFKQKIKQISDEETDLKKLETEITQKSEELAALKKKLEWSSQIKEMSKKTTNVAILQLPEIKEKYDFSEPQPLIIFIFSMFGWLLTCFIMIKFKNTGNINN